MKSDHKEKVAFKEFHEHAVKNGAIINKSSVIWENEHLRYL